MSAKTISVAQIGHGRASQAIRDTQQGTVLVSKENRPAAWIIRAEKLAALTAAHSDESASTYQRIRELLAIEQYRQGDLTLGQAANHSNTSLSDFIDLRTELEVPILWPPNDGFEAEQASVTWMSESALAEDWDRPTEHEAWSYLQPNS